MVSSSCCLAPFFTFFSFLANQSILLHFSCLVPLPVFLYRTRNDFFVGSFLLSPKTVAENWVSKQSFFCFDIDYGLNHIFLGIKLFCFTRQNLTKFQLNQMTNRKNENNNCLNKLNKLKLCEVSRNSISNKC